MHNPLEEENRYCPLTGVLNKRSLQKELDKKFFGTVIAIDLVGFSLINIRQGHHQGDLILKEIASKIKSIAGDNPVFRFGGDEFIILANNDDDSEQILKNLESCGYAMYLGIARTKANINELIKKAFSQIESQKLKNF